MYMTDPEFPIAKDPGDSEPIMLKYLCIDPPIVH